MGERGGDVCEAEEVKNDPVEEAEGTLIGRAVLVLARRVRGVAERVSRRVHERLVRREQKERGRTAPLRPLATRRLRSLGELQRACRKVPRPVAANARGVFLF